jgi:CheY-like chemotaxis protein
VLLAVSDADTRTALEADLRDAGLGVSAARTGFEAIVKATCNLPDLILLHEWLPDLGADDTARMLATCPTTAQIPIVRVRSTRVPKALFTHLRRRVI